jgi:hypothetical protein
MVTLIVRNSQGASDTSKHDDRADARDHLFATWHDPENLTAQLIDSDGQTVYEGPAVDLPQTSTTEAPRSDAEWSDEFSG